MPNDLELTEQPDVQTSAPQKRRRRAVATPVGNRPWAGVQAPASADRLPKAVRAKVNRRAWALGKMSAELFLKQLLAKVFDEPAEDGKLNWRDRREIRRGAHFHAREFGLGIAGLARREMIERLLSGELLEDGIDDWTLPEEPCKAEDA